MIKPYLFLAISTESTNLAYIVVFLNILSSQCCGISAISAKFVKKL